MGTKNNPGQFDCYAAAGPDEPMFVLLARDRHAATFVRAWAIVRARTGEDEEKVAEALACADAMDSWRAGNRTPAPHDDEEELLLQAVLIAVTEGMDEHPDGFDSPCDCNLCRSCA